LRAQPNRVVHSAAGALASGHATRRLLPLAPGSLPRYSGVPAARAGWQQGPKAAPLAPAACAAGGTDDTSTL
jgi:hypothetical protein